MFVFIIHIIRSKYKKKIKLCWKTTYIQLVIMTEQKAQGLYKLKDKEGLILGSK